MRLVSFLVVAATTSLSAQQITSPIDHFGFNIGDDYHLAPYTQFVDYWRLLDRESDRMVVQEIGQTAEGRPQLMAIVTSPENHASGTAAGWSVGGLLRVGAVWCGEA